MNILRACEYSKLANSNKLSIEHEHKFIQNAETGADMYIINRTKENLILTFRGSENAKDWHQNIKVIKIPFLTNEIKVHRGFHGQYASVSPQIINHIKDSATPIKNIYCVGHSLGGALATIAGIDLKMKFRNIRVECYTFGAPRVGNNKFKNLFNDNIDYSARVVYSNDIVARVPSCFRSYQHTNKKIKLHSGVWWKRLFKISSWKDHDIDNYLEALKKLNINI